MSTPDYTSPVSEITASGRIEIDSLLSGYKWGIGGKAGEETSLTYSFGIAGLSAYRNGYLTPDPGSVWTLSGTAQAAIRQAIGTWTAVANITCTEVADDTLSCGDIRFGGSRAPATAYTVMPVVDLPEAGDIWFGTSFADPSLSWMPGTYTYQTIVHEIGHALGLKHPHEAFGDFPTAPTSIDAQLFSTMSYRSYVGAPPDMGYWQDRFATTPMVNDIAAVQYLYGANMSTNAGDTVYSWQPGQAIFETIWDGGGTDTVSWANQTAGARIDLRPGSYSDLGPAWISGFFLEHRTLGIAYDCWIENAIGGAGNDVLSGNSLDNALYGGAGDDLLMGETGNDTLDGGAGNDTAVFGHPSSFYSVLHSGVGEVTVIGPDGTDTLRSIEQLSFGDLSLVLNPDATPGTPMGATFAVTNTASGRQFLQEGSAYSGPVHTLQWQLIGCSDSEAIAGSSGNDFINTLGGMDAINAGAGDDVLDGGTGSNFLTGGAGQDIFFLDGRSGDPVWSTVTDLKAGELVTVWGWQPGHSTLTWANGKGAGGFEGATAHIDLNGDGRIDASVTLSGHAASSLSVMPGVVGDTGYLGIWLFR